jgi:hypothetical protein
MNNDQSVKEINAVISQIEKALKPNCEIGARDRATVSALLKNNKVEKKVKFFDCRREHSDKILLHFVKEKGIAQNKFSGNQQTSIYLLY